MKKEIEGLGPPSAGSPFDSLALIARDAASYAEGAGEPEFSQFLNIEARILAMVRVKASLEPCVTQLADALQGLLEVIADASPDFYPDLESARSALRLAGRIA